MPSVAKLLRINTPQYVFGKQFFVVDQYTPYQAIRIIFRCQPQYISQYIVVFSHVKWDGLSEKTRNEAMT